MSLDTGSRGSVPDPMPEYAEIAVQLPVYGTYHYVIPDRLHGRELVGVRALVPFGRQEVTGVVVATSDRAPDGLERILPITTVLDAQPLLARDLLQLSTWIAEYYEAPLGEVLRTALPAGMQVTGKRLLELTATGRQALTDGGALSRAHRDILGRLMGADKPLAPSELTSGRIRGADISALIELGQVRYVHEVSRPGIKARTVRTAVLTRDITDDDRARLSRSRKKLAALERLLAAGGAAPVASLKADEPHIANHLRALAKLELVRFEERPAPPRVARPDLQGGLEGGVEAPVVPPALNERQRAALAGIRAGIRDKRFAAYLLHGITGSGKTEVYLNAIADILEAGKGAIVLVPEISLTPQLAARFRARFGDLVAVLHSGLTARERFDEWQRLAQGSARIALGARSAVFAPVADLGVMVVDEEHDSSFKQEEGVRYNARHVALVRAQRAGAVCILGSATPALESYHAALSGRYQLLRLPERATPRPLPTVELIDLRTYKPDGDSMVTAPLATALAETLDRGEQAIVFLNRRGFDTFVLCRACGQAFRCTQCSVSLTYHRHIDKLMCHYCGYSRRVPADCPSCNGKGAITRRGLGTEKVADGLRQRFPEARVGRLDRDVATGARIGTILGRFARGELDVLVGTQMVTKGHDFPGVTLVGVLLADTGLSLPDFRAAERTFQLLTQVAGRAGRGDRPGRVLIQSYRTDIEAVAAAAKHDYEGFYRAEITHREELGYPPFGHLVAVRVDGPDAREVEQVARRIGARARHLAQSEGRDMSVLGPSEAPLSRLKGRTRWHVWLRAAERRPLRWLLRAAVGSDMGATGRLRVTVDVDPISAL